MRLLSEAHEVARQNGIRRAPDHPTLKVQDLSYREMRADIATALHVSERTIERHISDAYRIVHDYADVHAALSNGHISLDHARVIADAGAVIGADTDDETARRRQHYMDRILPIAFHENAARLRPIARRLAEQFAQVSLEERHEVARAERRVWVQARDDGMADLTAYMPAVDAYAIYDLLTRTAKSLNIGGEPRKTDEIRTDIFRDRLLDELPKTLPEPSDRAEIVARVQLVIPVSSTRGDTKVSASEGPFSPEDPFSGHGPPPPPPTSSPPLPPPPYLEGYGPIDDASAHELAAQASHWERVRVDDETGTILSVDRYRPSEEMRRFITARDQRCRFPGCRVPANRCDIDHTVDAAHGGPTSTDNLGSICRGHHTLKHHSGWRVKQRPNGTFEWTSPTGRKHLDRPASRVTFTNIADPRTLNDDVAREHPF